MTTQRTQPRRTRIALSPEMLRRIDALDGCRGRWIVDCRAIEGNYSYALRSLDENYLLPDGTYFQFRTEDGYGELKGGFTCKSAEMAALYCAESGWQSRLLWHSDWIDDDARWPGGYDAPSIVRSNARVFREEFAKELERADGDADGLSLDVRFISDEMLETLLALENYPLISEDDHSQLELELQDAEWESHWEREWRQTVAKALEQYAPEADDLLASEEWAEDVVGKVSRSDLYGSFHACMEMTNTYWEEQCCGMVSEGYWVDLARLSEALNAELLAELTGLPLLPPEQQWRREPYPWPGAEPSPLVPPMAGGADA